MENEHYAFIAGCLADPGNTAKQQALREWLAASAEHRALYEALKTLWETAGDLPPVPLDRTAGWDVLLQQLSAPRPAPRTRRISMRWWKAAAILLPLLTVAGYWLYHTKHNKLVTYTALHAKDSVVLPDGSAVYLQRGARLSWSRNFSERQVQLEAGEAFFLVVKDEQHRFSITAPNATVKVLGTSFNVSTRAGTTDVVVWEGKVSLDDGRHPPVVLRTGEMGIAGGGHDGVRKQEGDHRYRCGWANNNLVFYNQPVERVLQVLASHYQLGVMTPNPKLRGRRVTVRFDHLGPEEAINVLNALLDDELIKLQDTLRP
ncbi:FecR domain-containing protein [uncultured Chitinophaga sp.]|jgi:Fe2+-dicitrate sensor, membrane component|uniref:FecR domain-containing protein n=1 Tax=uncultured Chitinophaga sp. TaxID=339340 RepID=UPI0026233CA3|nr:FecR domain-containing protein [uncultured Chitinophaga sp.]